MGDEQQKTDDKGERSVDALLQILVALSNRFKMEMGITLLLPGGLVTGTLIGVREYLREYGDLLGSGFDQASEGAGDVMRNIMSEVAKDYDEKYSAGNPDEDFDLERWSTNWLHLKNAKYVHGSTFLAGDGLLLRFRVSDVVTYNIGLMSSG